MRRAGSIAVLMAVVAATAAGSLRPTAAVAQVVEPDAAVAPYGSVTGSIFWVPGLEPVVVAESWCATLTANAQGLGDEAGTYSLQVCGSGFESPAGSFMPGSGSVSGSGPEGTVSGSFIYQRTGMHIDVTGSYTSNGETHLLQLSLDAVPMQTPPQPITDATVMGQALFADE